MSIHEHESPAARIFLLGLFAALLIDGCYSKAGASAPKIGCPESEIEISDEGGGFQHTGWVATCRGRRFICGTSATGEKTSDLSCSEELSASTSKRASSPVAAPTADASPRTAGDTNGPRSAAGFKLGIDDTVAKGLCEKAGRTYARVGADATCSGAANNVTDKPVTLGFCKEKLCSIDYVATVTAGRHPAEAYRDARDALQKKYGEPSGSNSVVPTDCRDDVGECIADGRATLEAGWVFPSSQRKIALTLRKEGAEGPVLRHRLTEGYVSK